MRGRKHTAPGAAGRPGRLDGRGGWAGPRRVAPAGGGSPFYEGHENGRAPRGPLLSFQGAEPTALKDIVREW